MAKQLLLVFGIPKSGTTFLQRMLNMHPEVSCPVEQAFTALANDLAFILDRYQRSLSAVDRRTGGQGIPIFDTALRNNVLAAMITALADSFAGSKRISGLNDNSIIDRPAYYDEILHRPKMIAIFRDPVDTAVSTWRHNRRLAAKEPDNAANHLQRLRSPDGSLDGYVQLHAKQYKAKVVSYLAYSSNRPNFVTTTYEALVSDRANELQRLFRFLDCDHSPATIAPIVAASSREAMAKTATDPEFFGIGRRNADEPTVSGDVQRRIRDQLRDELQRLGYRERP